MGLRISREVAARIRRSGLELDPGKPLALRDARATRELAARLGGGVDGSMDASTGDEISAGRLRAAIELAAVLRRRLEAYFESDPVAAERLLTGLERRLGRKKIRQALAALERELLGADVEIDRRKSDTEGEPAVAESALTELVLAYALAANPETAPVGRALQGRALGEEVAFETLFEGLAEELGEAPPFDEESSCLRDSLLAPGRAAESLPDQLRFILDEWHELDAAERGGLLGGLDLIAEENAPRFPPGPGPVEMPDYLELEDESAYFSRDLHWMEPLVLMAKNSHVWLDQLARRYGREINRLDQIPDEELEQLARQGIGGLWLIGIWSRSPASARIKRLMGNEQALASAYSVRDYRIAEDLGGAEAAAELAERASEHGIRLAADMVPNHMGLDSTWLLEHPERFLSLEHSPFPTYTFDGPDLSPDSEIGIFLEDHYYDRSDAAVVFKRVDRRSGESRYIYHGNDGTSTPWNDTAQLDFLNPETREAVSATILRVAGSFPIIRFDAAMTLARRHVRRLWFPEPGSGGAIPSRSDHALTAADFERAMPNEFWRDVVARVATERPDTLLLAEAFWLMEGYFVRSLGMHRVYNSAFMHLLRDGETSKLKGLIEETLAFDPEILKRFVNFLSNPDEETAIEQFGADDRYFGACVVLATLPGLPLVAHGQFEGLREKYGMEFQRARLDEAPDPVVVRRHRREIYPLLRRRGQFAGVDRFRLLAFRGPGGEKILAYANGSETERSLVIFNNSSEPASGVLGGFGDFFEITPRAIYRFRDMTNGVKFLCEGEQLAEGGLPVSLAPYEARVLVDFRPVLETVEEPYRTLARRLGGRGVDNIELELELLPLLPLIEAAAAYVASDEVESSASTAGGALEATARALRPDLDAEVLSGGLARVRACDSLEPVIEELPWPRTQRMQDARRHAVGRVTVGGNGLTLLRSLWTLEALRAALGNTLTDELWERSVRELAECVAAPVVDPLADASLLWIALEAGWVPPTEPPGRVETLEMLTSWVEHGDAVRRLGLNRFEGEAWVRKEEIETLLAWRGLVGLCGWLLTGETEERAERALGWIEATDLARRAFADSGYAFGRVKRRLGKRPARKDAGSDGAPGSKPVRKRRRRRKSASDRTK